MSDLDSSPDSRQTERRRESASQDPNASWDIAALSVWKKG